MGKTTLEAVEDIIANTTITLTITTTEMTEMEMAARMRKKRRMMKTTLLRLFLHHERYLYFWMAKTMRETTQKVIATTTMEPRIKICTKWELKKKTNITKTPAKTITKLTKIAIIARTEKKRKQGIYPSAKTNGMWDKNRSGSPSPTPKRDMAFLLPLYANGGLFGATLAQGLCYANSKKHRPKGNESSRADQTFTAVLVPQENNPSTTETWYPSIKRSEKLSEYRQ